MRTQATGARSLFSLFSSKESVLLLFFLEEKTGRLAREAQALRRTDAGTSCVVVGRNTTAGMPPSSALSLPVSAAPARQLSRANRPRKRKSIAEQLSFCAPAAFANLLHKTDGSHTNRPFFCSGQDVRESIFSQIDHLSRSVFCFFSSRKEIVPLLFFLEEKNGQLAREAQALRRTDAGTSCVVVGRNTTAGMPPSSALSLPVSAAPARQLSRANRPRKRKSIAEQLSFCAPAAFANLLHKTDGSHTNRPFFCSGQDVRESIFSQIDHLSRSVFCFFSSRKEIVPLLFFLEEKKSFPCRRKENVLL